MSATGAATTIGDITLIIGEELPTGTQQQAGATGSRPHVLERPGARPGDMAIPAFPGRTGNREDLNKVVLSVRGRNSDRAPVNKLEAAKWPPVANEAGAVAAHLPDQAVGITSGGQVNAGCPAGVQVSEAEAADIAEEAVGAGEAEAVEGNEENSSRIFEGFIKANVPKSREFKL
jgi:hypothetical protein